MRYTTVLGVPLSVIKKKDLLDLIGETIRSRRQISLVAVNARKIVRTVHEPEMKKLIMGFDVFLADGASVVKAAGASVERITGIDLMEDICRNSARLGARIFFYGASEENNCAAQKHLREKYPDIQIAGYCNGYDDEDVLEKIRKSGANVLFVAKGTPLQERWIMEYGILTGVNILMGIGGALDVCSGSVRRAPDLVQRAGLEWLYRMLSEPKRFAQIPELIEFRRLVNAEKKQNFRKIDGGRVWKAKKLR